MYTSWPNPTGLRPVVNPDNKLDFTIDFPEARTPPKMAEFLHKLGWTEAGTHPDQNFEQMWSKQPPQDGSDEAKRSWASDLQYGYWHWYEAVAYEFAKFIGIDDDAGEQRAAGFGGASEATQAPSQQHK